MISIMTTNPKQGNQSVIHLGNWNLHCKKTSIGCITWLTERREGPT